MWYEFFKGYEKDYSDISKGIEKKQSRGEIRF
jgi:hypothetical protein